MAPLIYHILFVLVFCCIWYGAMLLIGIVFESRLVPMLKLQSRAFFPGDIALGVMFLALWREYYEYNAHFPGYWWAVSIPLTMGLCIFNVWLLKKDRAYYPKRAANSPTKLWHDIAGFFVIEIVIVNSALLLLIEVIRGSQSFGSTIDPIMFVIALVFYESCDIWDFTHPATRNQVNARHTADWKPIWKKAP